MLLADGTIQIPKEVTVALFGTYLPDLTGQFRRGLLSNDFFPLLRG